MADNMDVAQVQAALQASGAGWQAGATALTALSEAQRRLRLGYVPGPGEPTLEQREQIARANFEAFRAGTMVRNFGAPAAFDLRDVEGQNYITSIKDQGNCGSCVAFGAIAAVEGTARLSQKDAGLAIDCSEAQLFYCHARAQGRHCNNGWWVPPALDCLKNPGVADEQCYPYTDQDQNCTNLCNDWQKRAVKIGSWRELSSVRDMKDWLCTKGPLVACFIVYEDFYAYKSGVYRHVSGARLGGHCVCCIGYNDTQGCWICKNSWGSANWGEEGFFRIGYGECGIDTTMWTVEHVSLPVGGGWQKNKRIIGLWGISEPQNAWVYVVGLGWRKISPEPDVFPHLLALLVSAKMTGSRVDFREENQVIKEVYVF